VEGIDKSLCISSNAPWGCGKTFIIKLIKAKLQHKLNELETEILHNIKHDPRKDEMEGVKDLMNKPYKKFETTKLNDTLTKKFLIQLTMVVFTNIMVKVDTRRH
jgi:hypothetical protein